MAEDWNDTFYDLFREAVGRYHYRTGLRGRSWFSRIRINNPLKEHTLDRFYDAGIDWVFSHKTVSIIFCVVSIPLCVFLFYSRAKELSLIHI